MRHDEASKGATARNQRGRCRYKGGAGMKRWVGPSAMADHQISSRSAQLKFQSRPTFLPSRRYFLSSPVESHT